MIPKNLFILSHFLQEHSVTACWQKMILQTCIVSNIARKLNVKDAFSKTDIYVPCIQYILSRFTQNGHILMAVFGVVYGFLFSKSVQIFGDKMKDKLIFPLIILFGFFFSLATLGGVRQCTGFYLFFWGVASFIKSSDRRWLYLVVLHLQSIFLIYLLFLLYCYFLCLREKVLTSFYLFLLSLIVSFSGLSSLISPFLSFFDSIESQTIGYFDTDMIEYHEILLQLQPFKLSLHSILSSLLSFY